ncbi:hypothetical protein BJ508DRAFT_419841 [Ascobolus immersus RN42]|uniref:Uncharacterized protein n=1 Tax=Ascobolus immersus RN42 TaxID=1160509 RepID=A0A3N4HAW7_ASCIM|nr:hypothetical protein BJ508DRAFT_419841 [Ascobolus immersus RN42]
MLSLRHCAIRSTRTPIPLRSIRLNSSLTSEPTASQQPPSIHPNHHTNSERYQPSSKIWPTRKIWRKRPFFDKIWNTKRVRTWHTIRVRPDIWPTERVTNPLPKIWATVALPPDPKRRPSTDLRTKIWYTKPVRKAVQPREPGQEARKTKDRDAGQIPQSRIWDTEAVRKVQKPTIWHTKALKKVWQPKVWDTKKAPKVRSKPDAWNTKPVTKPKKARKSVVWSTRASWIVEPKKKEHKPKPPSTWRTVPVAWKTNPLGAWEGKLWHTKPAARQEGKIWNTFKIVPPGHDLTAFLAAKKKLEGRVWETRGVPYVEDLQRKTGKTEGKRDKRAKKADRKTATPEAKKSGLVRRVSPGGKTDDVKLLDSFNKIIQRELGSRTKLREKILKEVPIFTESHSTRIWTTVAKEKKKMVAKEKKTTAAEPGAKAQVGSRPKIEWTTEPKHPLSSFNTWD